VVEASSLGARLETADREADAATGWPIDKPEPEVAEQEPVAAEPE
jgi:hypothetical protein